MISKCLVLAPDGLVVNAIVVDTDSDWRPDYGTLIAVSDTPQLDGGAPWIGWRLLDDGTWQPPAPFPSWSWIDGEWAAPVPMPTEGGPWVWDDETLSWVEVTV